MPDRKRPRLNQIHLYKVKGKATFLPHRCLFIMLGCFKRIRQVPKITFKLRDLRRQNLATNHIRLLETWKRKSVGFIPGEVSSEGKHSLKNQRSAVKFLPLGTIEVHGNLVKTVSEDAVREWCKHSENGNCSERKRPGVKARRIRTLWRLFTKVKLGIKVLYRAKLAFYMQHATEL